MARENVQALKAVYARWETGDFWTPEIFADDAEVMWAQEIPEAGEAERGLAAVTAGMKNWLSAWDECRWKADEFIPAGDQVVVFFTARGRGKGSTVEVEARWAHLWTFRDGKATRVEGFTDRAEALEAAGLSSARS
jgi:ketosteroid isomerase-like protein